MMTVFAFRYSLKIHHRDTEKIGSKTLRPPCLNFPASEKCVSPLVKTLATEALRHREDLLKPRNHLDQVRALAQDVFFAIISFFPVSQCLCGENYLTLRSSIACMQRHRWLIDLHQWVVGMHRAELFV